MNKYFYGITFSRKPTFWSWAIFYSTPHSRITTFQRRPYISDAADAHNNKPSSKKNKKQNKTKKKQNKKQNTLTVEPINNHWISRRHWRSYQVEERCHPINMRLLFIPVVTFHTCTSILSIELVKILVLAKRNEQNLLQLQRGSLSQQHWLAFVLQRPTGLSAGGRLRTRAVLVRENRPAANFASLLANKY